MADSFTYDGTDASTLNVTVERFSGFWIMSDIRLQSQPFGAKNGGASYGDTLGSIFPSMTIAITGTSNTDLQTNVDAVKKLVAGTGGAKALTLDAISNRKWTVRVHGPFQPSVAINNMVRVNLEWRVDLGYSEATSATNQAVTVDEDPESFNVPAAGSVAGTDLSRPIYTITQDGAGGSVVVTLTNTTRTEAIRWTGTLTSTHILRIDANRGHVDLSTDGGTNFSNAMGGKRAGDPFPKLTSDVVNAFTLTGSTTLSLSIDYTARFL